MVKVGARNLEQSVAEEGEEETRGVGGGGRSCVLRPLGVRGSLSGSRVVEDQEGKKVERLEVFQLASKRGVRRYG